MDDLREALMTLRGMTSAYDHPHIDDYHASAIERVLQEFPLEHKPGAVLNLDERSRVEKAIVGALRANPPRTRTDNE